MQLKNTYSAREVAAHDRAHGAPAAVVGRAAAVRVAVAPKPTDRGGFTERRYTPVDVLELMVLADLRRQGLSVVAHSPAARDAARRGSASGSSRRLAAPAR